jgi:hypothetical protein
MSGIHLDSMLGHMLVVLEYTRAVYDAMGFDGELALIVRFQRVRGVSLYAFSHNSPEMVGASRFDDTFRCELTLSTDRLRTERDAIGREILHSALFALGWGAAGQANAETPLSKSLLRKAYEYNFWRGGPK